MEKANTILRDATEQLREVLMHRLRCESRIDTMHKRLAMVKESREKNWKGGGINPPYFGLLLQSVSTFTHWSAWCFRVGPIPC